MKKVQANLIVLNSIIFLFFLSIISVCLGSHKLSSPTSPLTRSNSDNEYIPEDVFSRVNSTDFTRSSASSTSSSSFEDLGLVSSKKKLLSLIQSYLKFDKKLSVSDLATQMKTLQKKSLVELSTEFEQDLEFVKRVRFLQNFKTFLMRYQNMTESVANREINQLENLSIEQIYQKYYDQCAHLTKNQMLTMIHEHIQFDQGFFGSDADSEIAQLSKEPLITVRDKFMQYQRTFVTQDAYLAVVNRKDEILKQFNDGKSKRSVLRKVPLIHNITTLLPSKITNWSDQELFSKIEKKMQDLGFAQTDIDQEIERLRQASIQTLQAEYPHLQHQLASRLYYFDTATHQDSGAVRKADFWLQQLHAWGSTVGALGLAAAGYDTTTFAATLGLTLIDPRLTFASGVTKRDLLDMIYAQYSTFDALKHAYVTDDYQDIHLWTKAELIEKISDCLNDLKIQSKAREELKVKCNTELSKSELEGLYVELNYVAHNEDKPSLSSFEKKVLLQTKSALLEDIQQDLRKLEIPQDKIDQTIEQLRHEDIRFIRTARIDCHEASTAKDMKVGVMPTFATKTETILKQAPKTIAQVISSPVIDKLSTDLKRAGKSDAYIHWKVAALQDHVAQVSDGKFEHVTDIVSKGYQAFSIMGLRHQLHDVVRTAPIDLARTTVERPISYGPY